MADPITTTGLADSAVLLHPSDNVLVATTDIPAGSELILPDVRLAVLEHIEVGHKIARWDLETGAKVTKYGAPIGSMTQPVRQGSHIHRHNMASDYLAPHDRNAVET